LLTDAEPETGKRKTRDCVVFRLAACETLQHTSSLPPAQQQCAIDVYPAFDTSIVSVPSLRAVPVGPVPCLTDNCPGVLQPSWDGKPSFMTYVDLNGKHSCHCGADACRPP
jgi:hypothetical protein